MTLTEQVKVLDDKIIANKAQNDLDKEAAKISALSSSKFEKYEYLTSEDSGYKLKVLQKVKFQYSPLGEALKNNAKTKTDKILKKDKGGKHLVYNQQHRFTKFKDISNFKEISLDSMHKRLNDFHKKTIKFKGVDPQTEANEDLKAKVLDNAGDIFNELYYIYKEKHEEEKDALNEKDTKKFDYTELRLSHDYEYEFEKEEKETDKRANKKEPPNKPTENSAKELSKLVNKEKTDMNWGLFQKHFKFTNPSVFIKKLCRIKNKIENKKFVD